MRNDFTMTALHALSRMQILCQKQRARDKAILRCIPTPLKSIARAFVVPLGTLRYWYYYNPCTLCKF